MPVVFTILLVGGLLLAYSRSSQLGVWATKPLASAGFIWVAWSNGAAESPYGRGVLAALVLSWVGDVLLIPKNKGAFLGGLVGFLLGHVAFVVAFLLRGIDWSAAFIALVVLLVPCVAIARWLLPHVKGPMKAPVVAYIVVITSMVATAVGTAAHLDHLWIPLAATCFFVSDLAVARERFVRSDFANKVWGLPLYYGAQLIFAATVGG